MLWLVAGCLVLGLFPVQIIEPIGRVTRLLVGHNLADTVRVNGWFLLAPMSVERASYAPLVFLVVGAASFYLAVIIVRLLYRGQSRRAAPWDCGYPAGTARMQDTAEGFGQPIRQMFDPFFRLERELPSPFDAKPRYRISVDDHFWHWIYLPIAVATEAVARLVGRLQQGRISVYLLYSFVTLIAMLVVVRL